MVVTFEVSKVKSRRDSDLVVLPICGSLAAEIQGIDFRTALERGQIDALRVLIATHGVIVFRSVDLSPSELVVFTRLFGSEPSLIELPTLKGKFETILSDSKRGITASISGVFLSWANRSASLIAKNVEFRTSSGQVLTHIDELDLERVTNRDLPRGLIELRNEHTRPILERDIWHSDLSFSHHPPFATFLYAVEVPGEGRGDTLFCNMRAAYETLSPRLRMMISELTVTHSAVSHIDSKKEWISSTGLAKTPPPATHPMVLNITETACKALFINPYYTASIDGLLAVESEAVLSMLYKNALQPEHIYRHKWREHDLVVWDNRSTMHYACHDYALSARRLMWRTTAD